MSRHGSTPECDHLADPLRNWRKRPRAPFAERDAEVMITTVVAEVDDCKPSVAGRHRRQVLYDVKPEFS